MIVFLRPSARQYYLAVRPEVLAYANELLIAFRQKLRTTDTKLTLFAIFELFEDQRLDSISVSLLVFKHLEILWAGSSVGRATD